MKTIILILSLALNLVSQEKKTIAYPDFVDLKRVDEPAISSDGQWLLYDVRTYTLASNTYSSAIYLQSSDGKTLRQLTGAGKKDLSPTWSPDGKKFAFVSNRSGSYQIWTMSIDGGEPKILTTISTEVSAGAGLVWSSDNKFILFASDVFPDCADDACNEKLNTRMDNSKVKAKVIDKLPFRVWDSFKDGKRSQLLIADVTTGQTTDIIQGDFDVPPIDLGGSRDFSISPDGKTVAFTMNADPHIAWSTNNDVFTMPINGGEMKKISTSGGADNNPVFSPDGKFIAFNSMRRAGFEADQTDLMIYEMATGKTANLTENFDRSIGKVVWSKDGKSLFLEVEDQGYHVLYQITSTGGQPKKLTEKTYDNLVGLSASGLISRRTSFTMPHEIFSISTDGKTAKQLTQVNTEKLAMLNLPKADEFWFKGADSANVHGFLLKPPQFDAAKKYAMVYLVHGGPQGAWTNSWSWRWNPELFAAPGYVVALVNPRGSTGYGQKFTDEITKDWGGRVYVDLMNGVDYLIAANKFIDPDRIGAAGGSYGGYMMNWMNGHTDRFKCFVSHASIMNKYNMYGGTEEMWFEEWETGGPYWEGNNKELYEKMSPYNYVQNFKTPTLVVHGELDYRVPVIEGVNLFQVLQRRNIPSKFLYFPDEGHWILKPQNGQLWYQEVHGWLDRWLVKKSN